MRWRRGEIILDTGAMELMVLRLQLEIERE
jgi:hypothetical protein